MNPDLLKISIARRVTAAERRSAENRRFHDFMSVAPLDIQKTYNRIVAESCEQSYQKGVQSGKDKKSKEILDVLGVSELIEQHYN